MGVAVNPFLDLLLNRFRLNKKNFSMHTPTCGLISGTEGFSSRYSFSFARLEATEASQAVRLINRPVGSSLNFSKNLGNVDLLRTGNPRNSSFSCNKTRGRNANATKTAQALRLG